MRFAPCSKLRCLGDPLTILGRNNADILREAFQEGCAQVQVPCRNSMAATCYTHVNLVKQTDSSVWCLHVSLMPPSLDLDYIDKVSTYLQNLFIHVLGGEKPWVAAERLHKWRSEEWTETFHQDILHAAKVLASAWRFRGACLFQFAHFIDRESDR